MKLRNPFKPDVDADETDVYLETPTGDAVARNGEAMDTQARNGARKSTAGVEAETVVLPALGLRDRVVETLLRNGIVTPEQVDQAEQKWQQQGEHNTLWRVLAQQGSVSRDAIFAEAARIYAFRREEVNEHRPDPEFVKRVLESFTQEQKAQLFKLHLLPLEYEIDPQRGVLKLLFATHDPTRPETLRFVHDLKLDHFELCYAPESSIAPLLNDLFPRRNVFLERLDEDPDAFDLGASYQESGGHQLVDEEALDAEINRSGLINLFEAALVEAVHTRASDIHLFPNKYKQTEIHFRIDGQLHLWHTQKTVHPEAMLAVVKDRCGNVDRFDREIAQDGYIQREVDGALIRYRVSVLPVVARNREVKAESIVIRVLDDRQVFTDLSQIGLLAGAIERYKKAIRQPHGMIIMTGPTGSGKSTTLVAALHHVLSPRINALTIEDPVEYLIDGVRQVKLGPRLQLDNALRSVLRHDPDVVMVGEMRDRATAELAIKLANTGHLTFSTLHTNDAPSAVSRLFKMGIEPFLIAYAINLIVAQRLLRKLCPRCKEIDPSPDRVLLDVLGFTDEEVATTTFYKTGDRPHCKTCKGIGYRGRRAIAEALYFTNAIRHLIVTAGDVIDDDAIRALATREGMLTLRASAREIVKQGETSVDEILRVTTDET